MIAKRLALLFLIDRGVPTHAIADMLAMSSSTVARFEVSLDHYQTVISWLRTRQGINKVLSILADVLMVPFEAQRKSLNQILKEYD